MRRRGGGRTRGCTEEKLGAVQIGRVRLVHRWPLDLDGVGAGGDVGVDDSPVLQREIGGEGVQAEVRGDVAGADGWGGDGGASEGEGGGDEGVHVFGWSTEKREK